MLMPGPCSGNNLISILVTDYIQKRRGQALLFSFEYNLLPNLISNLNHYMDRASEYSDHLTLSKKSCHLSNLKKHTRIGEFQKPIKNQSINQNILITMSKL